MFEKDLQDLDRQHLLRRMNVVTSRTGPTIEIDGRHVILLASNNYLGLATHPRVMDAALNAIREFGMGAGASRLVSGTLLPHMTLETELARFKGTESALTYVAGYLANLSVIPALVGADGLALADRLCHASLIDGCRASRAQLRLFRHADANHLETVLKRRPAKQHVLIVTDALFSMDGDVAPLLDIATLAERYGAQVFVDDAHGTGIMGATGRGSLEHCGVESRFPFHMGTLSKAIGCAGGYIVGVSSLIQYLVNTSRTFIYTTAPPPAIAAAATAALRVIEEEPDRRAKLWENRNHLFTGLQRIGFHTTATVSPIIPILIGDAARALAMSRQLLEHGVYAPAIRPPTVPASTSRIRVTVTADHTPEQLKKTLAVFEHVGQSLKLL